MKAKYSLKKRLIIYISLFSIILGALLIFSAYRIALEEIDEILDAQMQNLAERVVLHNPQPLRSNFQLDTRYHEEDLFVDVWAYKDQINIKDPLNLLVPMQTQAGFYHHKTSTGKWHTYIIPTDEYQIQVSQQDSVRKHLAFELAGNMFIPYLLFLPLALWSLIWLIRRNLKPLDDFKQEITKRGAHELTHIQVNQYPVEISPTIVEMNQLFDRIELSQQEQKQFIADAAHELRTPITALNLQIHILLQQYPHDDAIKNLSKGLIRVQHLVSQLLSLAKQDASIMDLEKSEVFDLKDEVVSCVEQLIQFAMKKDIDLGMEEQQSVLLNAPKPVIHSIIFNLIDNAIKYTPVNGVINVSIFQKKEHIEFIVEDSGPGIDTEQYDKILKRFYRIHNHTEIGSGLGLSIVDKAIQHIHGQLEFSKSENLGGLKAKVTIPNNLS
jgi:two-component system, OmpR family, sensor kinase